MERLLALQEQLRSKVQAAGKRGAAERLAGDLVGGPFVTSPMVAARYGLSGQGAMNAIRTLVAIGILRQTPLRFSHGTQVYVADEVLQALE